MERKSVNHSESTARTGTFELTIEAKALPDNLGNGYDPYETWPSVRQPGSTSKQADLRRLSEWIRLQRQVSQLKKSDP
jgi:hypothetical protein